MSCERQGASRRSDVSTGGSRLAAHNLHDDSIPVLCIDAALDITYSVPSIAPNSTFPLRIEFYIADANNQEGKTFLGSDDYTTPGAKLATISAGAASVGTKIVAPDGNANGNTSEFSAFATVA